MEINEMSCKINELKKEIETLHSDIQSKKDDIDKLELEIENAKAEKLFQYCKDKLVGKYCQFTKKEELFTFKWYMKIDKCDEEYERDESTVNAKGEAVILTIRNDNSSLSTYTYDKEFSFSITSEYEDGLSGYFNAYNLEESNANAFKYAAERIKEYVINN